MAGHDASREPQAGARAAPAMSRWWWVPGVGAAALGVAAVLSPVIVSDGGAEPYLDFREGGLLLFNGVIAAIGVVVQTVTAFTTRRMPLTTIGGLLVAVNALILGILGWRLMEAEIARRAVEAAIAGIDAGNPRIGVGVWMAIASGAILSVVQARAMAFCFREDGRLSIWAR